MIKKIPRQVLEVLGKIEKAGFEAYVVGGCVRDLIMDRLPKDWDIATSAKPENIVGIFGEDKTFYENKFFTVGIKTEDPSIGIIEVTTYRTESGYSDRRRPDEVRAAETLEEDLGRRDFTMNAIALGANGEMKLTDPFDGQKDIEHKLIRTVGEAKDRFSEDALRMMRAIRFHSELGFEIEKETLEAIEEHSGLISHVALERIRDEFSKIVLSSNPSEGVDMMHKLGLLSYVVPELEKGVGVKQNRHHIYTIYRHCLLSLKYCPSNKLEVRLASLLHDIAKPQTKRGEGEFATFYNHDHVGSKVAESILKRLRYSTEIVSKVKLLVDNHMFYYNPDEVSESSVRRLVSKVGLENMKDLLDLRIADRLGSGTPKAKPYKLRHLEYMIDKVSQDAVSVKMLKVGGNDLMEELGIKPGPKIGTILDVLLAEVIEDASKNNREYLLEKAAMLEIEDLEKIRAMAKEKIEEKKEEDDKEIKGKHWVK
ncbi:MAG: PolyA polymerase [Candidatus Moranbacteria bacterium GW2011_GWE2_47_10]|nr:MAG: PolyA polymerase [Candidatus Moranbacteria bacterium GW2011_GWE2_47_10]